MTILMIVRRLQRLNRIKCPMATSLLRNDSKGAERNQSTGQAPRDDADDDDKRRTKMASRNYPSAGARYRCRRFRKQCGGNGDGSSLCPMLE